MGHYSALRRGPKEKYTQYYRSSIIVRNMRDMKMPRKFRGSKWVMRCG